MWGVNLIGVRLGIKYSSDNKKLHVVLDLTTIGKEVMEALAYAHLAAVYEASIAVEPAIAPESGNRLDSFNWKKLARRASSPALSLLAVSLSLFGTVGSSLAALQRGDSGQEVTNLQNLLFNSGYYDGPVTGYFGELTEEAVKRAQQAKGQSADGIADDRLVSSLQPASSSKADGGQLARGDSGQATIDLQNNLRAAGYYDGPVTGFFGSLTEAAVMEFQQAKGLTVNGIADQQTRSMLLSETAGTPSAPVEASASDSPAASEEAIAEPVANLSFGSSGADVTELQKRLQAAGYYEGTPSGDFDVDTEAAVIRFQRDQGLQIDGVAGRTTQRRLAAMR